MNGLYAVHFAVIWPTALRRLILAGADINVQDKAKRRPIQLALAMEVEESVHLLIEADCSLSTSYPLHGILQEALLFKDQQKREQISTLIIRNLINRHTRLLRMASAVFPPSFQLVKSIIPGKL